jgi:hypothetical protein
MPVDEFSRMFDEVSDIIALEQSGGSDRVLVDTQSRIISRMEADR